MYSCLAPLFSDPVACAPAKLPRPIHRWGRAKGRRSLLTLTPLPPLSLPRAASTRPWPDFASAAIPGRVTR